MPLEPLPPGAQVFSALCQIGQADYPAVRLDHGPYSDLTLVTRFKPIAGKENPGRRTDLTRTGQGQLLHRRGNALEDKLIFFVYVAGRRSQLNAADCDGEESGVWHDLRVDIHCNTFVASLDGWAGHRCDGQSATAPVE